MRKYSDQNWAIFKNNLWLNINVFQLFQNFKLFQIKFYNLLENPFIFKNSKDFDWFDLVDIWAICISENQIKADGVLIDLYLLCIILSKAFLKFLTNQILCIIIDVYLKTHINLSYQWEYIFLFPTIYKHFFELVLGYS